MVCLLRFDELCLLYLDCGTFRYSSVGLWCVISRIIVTRQKSHRLLWTQLVLNNNLYYAFDLHMEGYYEMMLGVCLSVCPFVRLSVVCLDLTRERKSQQESQNWQDGSPSNLFIVKGSKVKVTRPINAVADNASYACREIIVTQKWK